MNKVTMSNLNAEAARLEAVLKDAGDDDVRDIAHALVVYVLCSGRSRLVQIRGMIDVGGVFGEAVCCLNGMKPGLAEAVAEALRCELKGMLVADEHGSDISERLLDKLVAGVRLVGSLLLAGVCTSAIVACILQDIGFLCQRADMPESSRAVLSMPSCVTMSGKMPFHQPTEGDTVASYRHRLAGELDLSATRLVLLLHGTNLPPGTQLDEFRGESLTVLVRSPALKADHLVEAVCSLVLFAGHVIDEHLVCEVRAHLCELRPCMSKRIQFMISDLFS